LARQMQGHRDLGLPWDLPAGHRVLLAQLEVLQDQQVHPEVQLGLLAQLVDRQDLLGRPEVQLAQLWGQPWGQPWAQLLVQQLVLKSGKQALLVLLVLPSLVLRGHPR